MQLIYLAPLAWFSFAQRPHMFVRWFHKKYQCPILWINPYPTRFPELKDFKRIGHSLDDVKTQIPEWLHVISPKSLPIEPIAGSQFINNFLWQSLLQEMQAFATNKKTILAIGKPSALALIAIDQLPNCFSFYDAMDDYPQFYRGLSRLTFSRREERLVKKVSAMAVSSTMLQQKWLARRSHIQLIGNGLMPDLFLPAEKNYKHQDTLVLGYIGTVAHWFDWDWLLALANFFPDACVRIIGPVYTAVPENLPSNIEFLPSCDHVSAITAMKQFSIGLIPFKKDQLTASVDPIKYYEYRALGIPVISTAFGEMMQHQLLTGTFISHSQADIYELVESAKNFKESEQERLAFIQGNSWESRFASLEQLFSMGE
jgi:glycosyltransferase involved in cell wall biosynthesis